MRTIEQMCHKNDGIISDVIDNIIISNSSEEASSGEEEGVVMSGYMTSDSSDSLS
jgi:hypothetical protein